MSNNKTPEQLEQEQIDFMRGNAASSRFLRHNPTFKQSDENAKKMGDFVRSSGAGWSEETLTKIFSEHKDEFELNDPYVAPVPQVQAVRENLPPWGNLRNYTDVQAIPRAQYKVWFKDPQFQEDVNLALRGGR